MKRWLTIVALALLAQASVRGQGPGPGDQGAVLRTGPAVPVTAPKSAPVNPGVSPVFGKPSYPDALQDPFNPNVPAYPFPGTPAPTRIAPKFNRTDINKDIEVTKETGPWLIHVMTYTGEKAPDQARDFVWELRNTYKINAHVFNYGAKEKADEYKRALAEAEKQREALRKDGLSADVPLRIRVSHVQENTTVFIGGFSSRDAAQQVLEQQIKKLTPPDPKKVDLQIKYVGRDVLDDEGRRSTGKILVKELSNSAYKNPFASAFAVRNPALPSEVAKESPAEVVRFLRKVNAGEPLSLFQCNKKYTLAIKEYKTPVMMQEDRHEAKGFLERFTTKQTDWIDYAANNAHNVAEAFRKSGMPETYVLHTRYCSYVTVGGYDTPEDPNLLRMQSYLAGEFRKDAWRPFDLMPTPTAMEVPR